MQAARLPACIALLLLAAFALAFQGSRGLWEPDEGRYTDVAVEMINTGDFIHPAWNHDFRHYTKPPLTYWAMAAGLSLIPNEWGARLPNALAFAGTVLVLAAIGRRIAPGRPWLPAALYATSLLPFAAANIATTDTLLAFWETLGMLGFITWWCPRTGTARHRGWLLLSWVSFGIAFLTKGPPGLLPLLAAAVFVMVSESGGGLRRLFDPRGIAAFLLVGLSWYGLVVIQDPPLLRTFLERELVDRVARDTFQRNPHWYGAFTVYIPSLLLGFAPWSPFLIAGARRPWRLLQPAWWREELAHRPRRALLLLWFLLPLLVFAISRSRLPLYVLPLVAPLALLLGERWQHRAPPRGGWIVAIAAWCALLVAGRAIAAHYPYPYDSRAFARQLVALPVGHPTEVLFVDAKPRWALSLYLGVEVEHATSARAFDEETSALSRELGESDPGRIFAVATERAERFRRAAGDAGVGIDELGRIGEVTIFASWPRTPAAPAPASSPRGLS